MAKRRLVEDETLALLKQECIAEEKCSINGEPKLVHMVAKNLPFIMKFSSTVPEIAVNCSLVFDIDTNSQVTAFNQEVIVYTQNKIENKKFDVEFKLSVLSSQHLNALFKIKIQQTLPDGTELNVFSHPIKLQFLDFQKNQKNQQVLAILHQMNMMLI